MRDAALRERDSSLHAQREVAEGAARRLSLSQAGLGSLHMCIGHAEWYVHRAEKKRCEEQQRAKELH